MTFSHNLIIPLAFMKSSTMNPQYNHRPYPALHQLRGGSSVSDDIISTFKDELKKMRQDLKREAEMEYEATRQELQKKLGKKIMRKSDPLDLVGEDEDETLQVDDDEYEYIEEEIEVEVDDDEEEGEEEEGEEEEIVVVEEDEEEEGEEEHEEVGVGEEEHEHNDDDDSSTEEFVKEVDLESSHSRLVSEDEDEKEQSDDLTSIPTKTLEDYSAIDTASDSQRTDKDDEGLMEDNAGHEEEEEEESEPSRDGIEPDKKQSIDAKKVGMDDHDYLRHIDNQDFLTNTATVNKTDGNIGTMETFEIGESEEIDGNVGMSEEEQGATNNIPKKHGATSSKKDKSVGKDSKSKKKKKNSKSGKQPKQKKRKSTTSKNSAELEKGSGSQIDSLAHDVALKTLPQQKSSLTTFVRAMIPTLITILLLILSHFMLEAIMKQFSPR